jgi:hypothetical protein
LRHLADVTIGKQRCQARSASWPDTGIRARWADHEAPEAHAPDDARCLGIVDGTGAFS